MTSVPDDRLLSPYRAIRRIGAGGDFPWSGLLVQLASGESRVLVDANGFGTDWAGWRAPADGHVLAPLDVVRRDGGHDVLLPLCVERVEEFVARRRASRVPLSVGETVTLGVSLVRGFAVLRALENEAGEWWLTDAGRPVFAAGASTRDGAAQTSDLLRSLADGSPCAAALTRAAEVVCSPRIAPSDLQDAEDELFTAGHAEPLATALIGPRAARDLAAFDRAPGAEPEAGTRGMTWLDSLTRHVDADLADTVSLATTGLWRRLRATPSGGRRPWLFATGTAGVVLAAGLLWPTDAGDPATAAGEDRASDHIGSAAATPSPASVAPGVGEADVTPSDDLVAVTDRLLAARVACDGEASCLADVLVDPAGVFGAGAIDLESPQRETTLLDEFGGVAVLRVDSLAGTHDAQLVVVMLQADRWLLRDVHVANQPARP